MTSPDLPDGVVRAPYRVIYGDTDQMGIVYYANHLRFFERGRCEYLRALGVSYQSVEDAGFILPVADAHVSYKTPARFDDLLSIDTAIERMSFVKVHFAYRITNERGDVVCTGSTVHASLNKDLRPVKVPQTFRDKVTITSL